MEAPQSGLLSAGFHLRASGPAWAEAKKGAAAGKRKKAVPGNWQPLARTEQTKLPGSPRDAAVSKRRGVREVSTLLDALPSPPLPPGLRTIATLSVNNISTLEDYVGRPRGEGAAVQCAEHEPAQHQPAARRGEFVPLDALPLSVAAETAHGLSCPWDLQASSLLPVKAGSTSGEADAQAHATRQDEGMKTSGAINRRRRKGARPSARSPLSPIMDRISSEHTPSGALTDRGLAASPLSRSAEFGSRSPRAPLSQTMFKGALRSRPVCCRARRNSDPDRPESSVCIQPPDMISTFLLYSRALHVCVCRPRALFLLLPFAVLDTMMALEGSRWNRTQKGKGKTSTYL